MFELPLLELVPLFLLLDWCLLFFWKKFFEWHFYAYRPLESNTVIDHAHSTRNWPFGLTFECCAPIFVLWNLKNWLVENLLQCNSRNYVSLYDHKIWFICMKPQACLSYSRGLYVNIVSFFSVFLNGPISEKWQRLTTMDLCWEANCPYVFVMNSVSLVSWK